MNFPKNMLCLQGYHYFIIGLLRHCSVQGIDCLFLCCWLRHYTVEYSLYYYLFKVCIVSLSVCYVSAQFEASTVSSSVCYVAMLSPHGFLCFIMCLLRHHIISSRYVTSPWFLLKVS